MPQNIDILWLVEHVAREMDVAAICTGILQKQHRLKCRVHQLFYEASYYIRAYNPKVVIVPYFYDASNPILCDIIKAWPQAVIFDLTWEQLFYKNQVKRKMPTSAFVKETVIHHAWGDFFRDFLVECGITPGNIYNNGNPALQLYLPPYAGYYDKRNQLARQYQLDAGKKWLFVPESYKWALVTPEYIRFFSKAFSVDEKELQAMHIFSRDSLLQVLRWLHRLSCEVEDIQIIFRPKPSTSLTAMIHFFHQNVARETRIHFLKKESVRDWSLNSDIVMSTFSTSLIEAATAGKPVYFFEPVPLLEAFDGEWYGFLPHLKQYNDLRDIFDAPPAHSLENPLKQWARNKMLVHGDAIGNLIPIITQLHKKVPQNRPHLPVIIDQDRFDFPPSDHESDFFTQETVQNKKNAWLAYLTNIGNSSNNTTKDNNNAVQPYPFGLSNLKKEITNEMGKHKEKEIDTVFTHILNCPPNPLVWLAKGKERLKEGENLAGKIFIKSALSQLATMPDKTPSELFKTASTYRTIGDFTYSKKWYRKLLQHKALPIDLQIRSLYHLAQIADAGGNRKWKHYYKKCLALLVNKGQKSMMDYYHTASIYKVLGQLPRKGNIHNHHNPMQR